MDNQARINQLEEENAKLKEELQSVKEHLKKYTAPPSSKVVNHINDIPMFPARLPAPDSTDVETDGLSKVNVEPSRAVAETEVVRIAES